MSELCLECENDTFAEFPDPRDPPLEHGDCLCREHWISAMDEVIQELCSQVEQAHYELRRVLK